MKTAHDDERPANLLLWHGDGRLRGFDARVAAKTEVSIGRTDSKRALGFVVTNGKKEIDFVLNRDQVAELAYFLNPHSPDSVLNFGAAFAIQI
jgi:hypothetical protein